MIDPRELDRVRAALGLGYDEGAAWFSVDEKLTPFAPHKTPGHRALVLRKWENAPAVWVLARSRTAADGLEHAPHDHRDLYDRCWLGLPARIVTSAPFTVRRSILTSDSYMCAEPDETVTVAVLATPCSP